ncbi:MAG: 4-hydroxyphenylpyruvate dioxygenase [Deltaproteobacteria bacterium]|nr:4-hydroxyphenylpyruvate dioxygenase [Deltaproteobacteria bacterium]
MKEDPSATPHERARAERAFEEARAGARRLSESARIARLHWWTVEYGLVGELDDFRIFGAGLLSSLGESASCQSPAVRKRPLEAACIDVGYDITRPQPQLFVARSFEHLEEVLDEVTATLAQRRGGAVALEAALASHEVATLVLDTGVEVTGVVERVRGDLDEPAWIEVAGPAALAWDDRELAGQGTRRHRGGVALPLGPLADGSDPASLDRDGLRRHATRAGPAGSVELRFRSGVTIAGRVVDVVRAPDGRPVALVWAGASAKRGSLALPITRSPWVMPLGSAVTAGFAGPADPRFWPATSFPARRLPPRRSRPASQRGLLRLHRQARALADDRDPRAALPGLQRIAGALRRRHADEWLLRWELLGIASAAGGDGEALRAGLAGELEALVARTPAGESGPPLLARALATAPGAAAALPRLELVSPAGEVPAPAQSGDAIANPMGTDGFEFVEYATTDPTALDGLFRAMGLVPVARHRSKDVTLYRQGGVNFVVDAEPSSFAQAFARVHGPSICAIAFRVRDAARAFERAVALGAKPVRGRVGPMELNLPAIRGIGGSLIYLIDRYGDRTIYDVDFVPTGEAPPADVGLTHVDHLTHNVLKGRMNRWAEFYERLFGFREIRYFDIRGQLTGLLSRALVSPCGKIRIPVNEPTEGGSQIQAYLDAYHGEGIQHVALGCRDIFATVRAMRERGLRFLATPDAYFDALDARLPGHGLDVEELRRLQILVDGVTQGERRLLLQIFTEAVIGPIFFEIIERRGDEGFGEGNFRALFEAMERDQIERGVLAPRSGA